MARHSAIEWTHHTFNPWWGCTKVSPACDHCYAEAWAKRVGRAVWGAHAPRRGMSDSYWREPLRWNAAASKAGVRHRVFCASMADVFEPRPDLDAWRSRLWKLIGETPALDWLLLTKRPDHASRLAPWPEAWPENIWLGTTAEDQARVDLRVPVLLSIPARVRFLSCEPLLGPIELRAWPGIHWVIAGGESGPHARPMDPHWTVELRDQCVTRGIAFHFKQWGDWFPDATATGGFLRVGKKRAGRVLEGRTWDQFPEGAHAAR